METGKHIPPDGDKYLPIKTFVFAKPADFKICDVIISIAA